MRWLHSFFAVSIAAILSLLVAAPAAAASSWDWPAFHPATQLDALALDGIAHTVEIEAADAASLPLDAFGVRALVHDRFCGGGFELTRDCNRAA